MWQLGFEHLSISESRVGAEMRPTVDPDQNAYTNLTAQLPKDYCLIPGNCTVKLVETQKSPIVNHFQFWFWPDTLQVHRSASNKMDISPDIDPTEISEF